MEKRRCATKFCLGDTDGKHLHCSKCQMRKWRKRYPNRAAYSAFRTNAWRRGIEFRITLTEFTRWCRDNGYLKLRGMGADDMTIGRKDHYQPYTIGNIMMETKSENGKKGKTGKRPYYRPDGVPF